MLSIHSDCVPILYFSKYSEILVKKDNICHPIDIWQWYCNHNLWCHKSLVYNPIQCWLHVWQKDKNKKTTSRRQASRRMPRPGCMQVHRWMNNAKNCAATAHRMCGGGIKITVMPQSIIAMLRCNKNGVSSPCITSHKVKYVKSTTLLKQTNCFVRWLPNSKHFLCHKQKKTGWNSCTINESCTGA